MPLSLLAVGTAWRIAGSFLRQASQAVGMQQAAPDALETTGPAEFKPWREAGWIFRDGGCITIERQGPFIRAREVVD